MFRRTGFVWLFLTALIGSLICGAIVAGQQETVPGSFALEPVDIVFPVSLSQQGFTPDPDIDPSLPEPILRAHESVGGVIQESRKAQGIASGSTFYIGQGLWFTNRHVAEGVIKDSRLYVRMANGNLLDAQVVCMNPGNESTGDFALLQTADPGVPPLKISSALPQIGDIIFSDGYPNGAREIIRSTRVKELGAQVRESSSPKMIVGGEDYISNGNSGGPALNEKGEVVGVNSFGRNQDGAGIAIGAPLMIDFMKRVGAGEICS